MPPEDSKTHDDTGALESLRQSLYAPDAPPAFPTPTLTTTPLPAAAVPGWQLPPAPKKIPLSVLFLGVAGIFFLLTLGAAAWFLIFGGRAISSDHITIAIDAPTEVRSGDTTTLLIQVKNQNPTTITNTRLSVDFPDGAVASPQATTTLAHYEDTVGEIPSGETTERSIPVVLFGSQGQELVIPIQLEYRTAGSNAVFVKKVEYRAIITSSPLSVTVAAPQQGAAGQPITVTVSVQSHAQASLAHVIVTGTYPFGFLPGKDASSTVILGTLSAGEEKSFTVSGTLANDTTSDRTFTFVAGTGTNTQPDRMVFPYATGQGTVNVAQPFLSTTLSVGGDRGSNPVIQSGTPVQTLVLWQNTLSTPILDGQVTVHLSGDALDPNSITTSNGFYRSGDTSILFTKDMNQALARLAPGDTGSGSFTFNTKSGTALTNLRTPTITATVSVAGRRVGESGVPEAVTASVTRIIQIATDLGFTAQASYTNGPFKNSGPRPPKPNTETTYTITLAFTNTVNSVGGATVSATLPAYVRYTGAVSPQDGSVTYVAATRTITWNAGDIPAGTTVGSPKKISFQVALLPSTSQRGTSPVLMSDAHYSGYDRFTKKTVEGTVPSVTTQTASDAGFQPTLGVVQ